MSANQEPGVFEIMYSLRSMRRLKADPVPDELIWKVLDAGVRAPSGGNVQPWRFLVVRDAETKRFIQERYKRGWDRYLVASMQAAATAAVPMTEAAAARMKMVAAASHLAEHLHEAPVLLLVCMAPRRMELSPDPESRPPSPAALYASIFPAVQNVLLACRACGLGATLTTLHLHYEDAIKERLGIPAEIETVALLPIGWPVGRFGPVARASVETLTYWDRWGAARSR
ncbi:MAG: nitroreductase family protein [Deltaproteobacteria bacterium]|nr:nitroreductase family protein [Deltaproteobacteria bacterium]